MPDFRLDETVPLEMVLFGFRCDLEDDEVAIFREEVRSLEKSVPRRFAGHDLFADGQRLTELFFHHL